MKRLTLKKYKIAKITNAHVILGGGDNSNAATLCNNTGYNSVTCETFCLGCDTTNVNSPCDVSTPGTTRANSGKTVTQNLCPDDLD
ncbi:MAG: hypothetical protein AAF617_18405 [Bacteroidota bacterium]